MNAALLLCNLHTRNEDFCSNLNNCLNLTNANQDFHETERTYEEFCKFIALHFLP